MRQLKQHIPILEYIRQLSSKDQKSFISTASKGLLHCLSGICLNIVKRNIPLSPLEIRKLRKYEKEIKTLAERRHSLSKRKKILASGGFMSTLLTLLPTLVSAVIGAATR